MGVEEIFNNSQVSGRPPVQKTNKEQTTENVEKFQGKSIGVLDEDTSPMAYLFDWLRSLKIFGFYSKLGGTVDASVGDKGIIDNKAAIPKDKG